VDEAVLIAAGSCFQDDPMGFGSRQCDLFAELTCIHCPFSHMVIFHGGLFRGNVCARCDLTMRCFRALTYGG